MAVLLNAIILTVRYGIVPKCHLYLSQFIILCQPCKAVLKIYQLRHKNCSYTLYQGDGNGTYATPLPKQMNDILLARENKSLILGE